MVDYNKTKTRLLTALGESIMFFVHSQNIVQQSSFFFYTIHMLQH